MKLGDKILEYRKKLGLSQEQLGERVGVSRQTVSKWEIGQTIPELEKMILLSKEFGTTIDEMVNDDNEDTEELMNDKTEKFSFKNFIETHKKKIKIIFTILIILFSLLMIKVVYRYIVFAEFKDKLSNVTNAIYSLEYDENNLNWRIEESDIIDYGYHQDSKNYVQYYRKDNQYKKEIGFYVNPEKIYYMNYETGAYEIDCINKTYKKDLNAGLSYDEYVKMIDKPMYIYNEITENFLPYGTINTLKFVIDFDNGIGISEFGKFYVHLKQKDKWNDITISVGDKTLRYWKTEFDDKDKSKSITKSCSIDLDVVTIKADLPDLTEYVEIK